MLSASADASSITSLCWQGFGGSALGSSSSSAAASEVALAAAVGAPSVTVSPSTDTRIDALLAGTKWNTNNITYSFYAGGTYYGAETSPTPVSDAVKANVRYILSNVIAPLVNLTFTEVVTDTPTSYGTLRYLCSPIPGYAYAYYPSVSDSGGDVVLSLANDVPGSNTGSFRLGPGSYGFETLIHETCHALGLKHPGNYNAGGGSPPPPYLPSGEDNWDNTLMSYNQVSGKEPGTPMAYDLLALQYLYPANATTRSGDTTYVFSTVDDFSPGGVVASGASRFGDLKQSLWDGGGTDTVDCSSLPVDAQGYRIDVSPGGWITKTSVYNSTWYNVKNGSPWFLSGTPGNTYASTAYGTRIPFSGTTIENVVVSRSSDTIYLNAASNRVSGFTPGVSGGQDVITGSDQGDTLDLSLFRKSNVTETQSGNDLVINLGAAGFVTVKDYFKAVAGSRMIILYDDMPIVSIGDATIVEGDAGTSYVEVLVTLSAAATQEVSVAYTTADGSARTARADYFAASGTLTFLPGETKKTIQVTIKGDTTVEPDETFIVRLSNLVNAAPDRLTGIVTIRNDDLPPAVFVNDVQVTEGTGGVTAATFTIQLTVARPYGVSVRYTTLDRNATARDGDYRTVAGTAFIPAGNTSVTVPVSITADAKYEADERFAFQIISANGVPISRPIAQCTILNDDPAPVPVVTIIDVQLTEGQSAQKMFAFIVSLSATSPVEVSVGYRTADITATAGLDYVGTTGMLRFSPGMTKRSVTVWVAGDALVEPTERFALELLSPSGVSLGRSTGIGTILNDDEPAVLRGATATMFAAFASEQLMAKPAARRR